MNGQSSPQLAEVVAKVRDRISRLREDKNFNEQNTKASLIVPVLQALGWDTNDLDEVLWEYKPKPKYNPVDFALLLQRTPCLFIEAKALRDDLRNDKLVNQILSYASVAGVEWVVLSNGDEYRLYNAAVPVPAEEKLFRVISVSKDDVGKAVATLSLLSKQNLQDKKIGRLWASHFVDRQVKLVLEELFNPSGPAKSMVHAITKQSQGKLRSSEVLASLRRARLQLDFPQEPPGGEERATSAPPKKRRSGSTLPSGESHESVALGVLVREGLLRAPAELSAVYRGQKLRATLEADGRVRFGGRLYSSPSTAAGTARKPFHKGDLKGREYPQTNGWTFWKVQDPSSAELISLAALRDRYSKKKRAETERFTTKGV